MKKLARDRTMESSVRVFYGQIKASLPGLGSSHSYSSYDSSDWTAMMAIMLHMARFYSACEVMCEPFEDDYYYYRY